MAKAKMQDPFPEVQRLEKNLGLHGNNLRLLKHLASLSYPVNQVAKRSALEVAEEMGWPAENVSAYVERLQKDLARCYSMQSNPLHIVVHPGGRGPTRTGTNYLVELVDAVDHSATRRFWAPHLGHSTGPIVLTTNAPLFFHHVDDGYRVRVMGVNTSDELSRHRTENHQPNLSGCVECFHYLSAGDFRICMALTKLFTREGADIDPRIVIGVDLTLNDHYNPSDSVDLANTKSLIAIGNPRVS